MKYEYTRENALPIIVEMSHSDIVLIRKMVKVISQLEDKKPGGIWPDDLARLDKGAREILDHIAEYSQYWYKKSE